MKFDKRPDERYEIRLSGTGGQGIITAGMILGEACAFHAGLNTCMTQSYGPEARGGACRAELVFSIEEIDSPKPTNVDLLLAMSQEAFNKYKTALKEWGIIIVDSSLVKYEPASNIFPMPFSAIAKEKVGFAVTANIVAVGFIAALTGLADIEEMKDVVAKKVPPGTEKTNFKALEIGFLGANAPLSSSGISIHEHISKDMVTSPPDEMIFVAAERMEAAGVQATLVTNNGTLLGILTFSDVCKAIGKGYDTRTTPVKKFMVKDVVTATRKSSLGQLLLLMEEKGYKNIPILDDNGDLEGIVSYYHVQDEYSEENTLQEEMDFLDATRIMLTGNRWSALKGIATTPKKVKPGDLVVDAAAKMAGRIVDNVIVVDDEDVPVGIITENDIVKRVILRGLNPEKTTVEKVMTRKLVVLSNTETITEAYKRMVSGGFHHLPIVNKHGKLRGSVSLSDIAHIVHSRYYLDETITEDQIPPYED